MSSANPQSALFPFVGQDGILVGQDGILRGGCLPPLFPSPNPKLASFRKIRFFFAPPPLSPSPNPHSLLPTP